MPPKKTLKRAYNLRSRIPMSCPSTVCISNCKNSSTNEVDYQSPQIIVINLLGRLIQIQTFQTKPPTNTQQPWTRLPPLRPRAAVRMNTSDCGNTCWSYSRRTAVVQRGRNITRCSSRIRSCTIFTSGVVLIVPIVPIVPVPIVRRRGRRGRRPRPSHPRLHRNQRVLPITVLRPVRCGCYLSIYLYLFIYIYI